MKRFRILFLVLALTACSDDKDKTSGDNADKDASTDTSGASGNHGSSGSGSAGKTGGGGGTSTGHAGSTSSGGNGGSASGSGGTGNGNSGSGGGDDADDSGNPDMPTSRTTCKAPTPAQNAGNACPDHDPVALKATLVKDGFNVPVFVTQAPGDKDHLLVVERGGTIQRVDPASGQTSEFMNLADRVMAASGADGELGLLGMAFHPDYPDDPRFFLNYTTDPDDLDYTATTHISSFDAPSNAMGDADTEQVLIHYNQPQSNHNGGMLAFGPDGCLFSGAGDGGNSNDQGFGHATGGNGQQLDIQLGKILRIDVDKPDTAAPGNLKADVPQIWDYGNRNPWRFSFDRMTGDLYIGDVGQDTHEEVDVEPRGKGKNNYGWPIMEGMDCRGGGTCEMNGLTLPVDAYDHVMDQIDCVVGGYVYRGTKIKSLQGWYVYGDNGPAGKIRTFVWDGDGRCADTIVLSDRDGIDLDSDITSFGQDLDGELYITTHTSVYRIAAQ